MKRNTKKLAGTILMLTLILSLLSSAASAEIKVTEETAQEAALREIEALKEMGILSEKVEFTGDADDIYDYEAHTGDDSWFGRKFPHRYEVRWFGNEESDEVKYSGNICVDADTGKLSFFTVIAEPDAEREPVRELEQDDRTFYFYDNFEDIFPAELTVDRFCSLLAEYWGFDGYTLSDTKDEMYGEFEAVGGETLLKDMPLNNYYLTVFFDGDQEGVPMYVQIAQFIGQVALVVGTNHNVG